MAIKLGIFSLEFSFWMLPRKTQRRLLTSCSRRVGILKHRSLSDQLLERLTPIAVRFEVSRCNRDDSGDGAVVFAGCIEEVFRPFLQTVFCDGPQRLGS